MCWSARHLVLRVLLFLPLVVAHEATAQETFRIQRITGSVQVDGLLDEAVWDVLTPLPLVMYEPVFRGAMTEHTEVRVGYDDNYIYAAARLGYADVALMRANSMYRDRYSGDDLFSILIDTFNDRQHGLWFATNPNGVRLDYAISNDMDYLGDSPFGQVINASWNTYWDAATSVTDEGWTAEMRIPFSGLGFQDEDGTVEMGMAVVRWIPSKAEAHVFPAIQPNWEMGWAKPSQYERVLFDGPRSSRPLYITPYVAGGSTRLSSLDDDESVYEVSSSLTGNLGGDVKVNLNSNLTLDVTLNTDFAQAEADEVQVNLSRFPLFFPEKRQFFQERAGIFEFRTLGRFGRIFHSRRIGLHDGEAIPILGGARLVGRIGRWDVGLLNMQTAPGGGLPYENFGVYRVRRSVLDANSYVGGIVTTRIGSDRTYNHVYGFDTQLRVLPKTFLIAKWAQVLSNATGLSFWEDTSGGFARLRLERRTQIGLSYTLSGTWQGQKFEPGVGFLSRTGFVNPFLVVGYGWLAGESSRVLSFRGQLLMTQYYRDSNGSLDWSYVRFDAPVTFKQGDVHVLTLEHYRENFLEPLELPENTIVPAGHYTYSTIQWNYFMSDGRRLRTDVAATVGSFYDGSNVGFELEPTWNVSRHLEVGAAYQFSRVRFPDRGDRFSVHVGRLRAQIGFSTRMSVNAFVQYNASTDLVFANLRFRYNFREGNDLWLVLNEGRNTDRQAAVPVPPVLDSRTLLLKYTHTFIR